MTVSTDEFLRRFLIHVLPKGLVRSLFANRDEPHCCCVAGRCSALREVLVAVGIKMISNYIDHMASIELDDEINKMSECYVQKTYFESRLT